MGAGVVGTVLDAGVWEQLDPHPDVPVVEGFEPLGVTSQADWVVQSFDLPVLTGPGKAQPRL